MLCYRWLAAYTAAASFRYSHYFVSLLSQCGALSSGIRRDGMDKWYIHVNIKFHLIDNVFLLYRSEFNVVNPLAVELPRSLGSVVTNWNLPMHVFLKKCKE